jgi:hypothetical protein
MAATPAPPLETAGFEMKTAIIFTFYILIMVLLATVPALVCGIVLAGFALHAAVNWGK